MPKLRFIVDFQGRETKEQFFRAGEVAEFPADVAAVLVNEHRAVLVEEPKPEPKVKKVKHEHEETND